MSHEPVPSYGKAKPMAIGARRKERGGELLENFRIDSRSRIGEFDIDCGDRPPVGTSNAATQIHSGGDGEAIAGASHGLKGVSSKVQENLRESIGVAREFGDRGVVVTVNFDGFRERIDRKEIEHGVKDAVNVHFGVGQVVVARKDHEFVDQSDDAIHFADDQPSGLFRAALGRPRRQQFCGTANPRPAGS